MSKLIPISAALIAVCGLAVTVFLTRDDPGEVRQVVEQGDVDEQNKLAAPPNPDEVRQAAEQGDASAQFQLGSMYQFGGGVAQDDAEAARWTRLAAE